MKELTNRLITLAVSINRSKNNLNLIWSAVKVLNSTVLLLIVMQNFVISYFSGTYASNAIKNAYLAFSGLNSQGKVIVELSYLLAVMLVILFSYIIYYLQTKRNIIREAKKCYVLKLIQYYPLFVLFMVDLFYPFYVLYLIQSYNALTKNEYPTIFYISFAMSATLILLITLFDYKSRIFNLLFPCALALIWGIEPLPESLSIMFFSMIFIYHQKQLIDCCSYTIFIVVSIFNVMFIFDKDRKISTCIFLGFCLVLSTIGIIVTRKAKLLLGDERENNQFLMEYLRKLDQNQMNQEIMTLTKVEAILGDFYKKNRSEMSDFNPSKKINELTYHQVVQVIDKKLKLTSEKIKNVEFKKQFLLFRIENLYKIYETLSQISQFLDNQKNYRRMSYSQRYISKYVQSVVLQEFIKKQAENERIHQIKELSKIQENFINQSVKLIVRIKYFWNQVKMDVLIEDMIEINFYQIIQGLEKIRSLLNLLKRGYKAPCQTKLMEMIGKLVYPNHIQMTSIHPSGEPSKKQDSLNYFAIKNHNIVDVSAAFLKIMNLARAQIIGGHISSIIPEEIIECLTQRQSEAINSQKNVSIIPIICNNYLIKVYQAIVKLHPKVNSGIEFYYFLDNVEREEKRAYFYVNSVDLSIRYVSEQFFQIFGLKQSEIKATMKQRSIYINNIITNLNQDTIISDLQTKKVLKCQISILHMISSSQVGKPTKFNGILTLESKFKNHVLVSIHIISSGDVANFRVLKSRKKLHFKTGLIQNKTTQEDILIKTFQHQHRNRQRGEETNHDDPSQNLNIFCPIENPYRQKIQEKQSTINEGSGRRVINFSNLSIALSVVLVLLLSFVAIMLASYCEKQNSSVTDVIASFRKVTAQTNFLLSATYDLYTQYILSSNKEKIKSFIIGITPQFTLNHYLHTKYEEIHDSLKKFQQNFTEFFHREIFSSYKFPIVRFQMKIQTDLSKSSLLQYVENIKLASQKIRLMFEQSQKINSSFNQTVTWHDHPLQFIVNNYLTISEISAPLDSMANLLEIYLQELKIYRVVIILACVLSLVVLYFILIAVKANLLTVRDLFDIFRHVEPNQITKQFQQIQSCMKAHCNQIPKDSLKTVADLTQYKQNEIAIHTAEARFLSRKIILSPQEQIFLLNKPIVSNKKNPFKSAIGKVKGIIILTLVFLAVLAGFYFKMEADLQQDKINLEYYRQIEKIFYQEQKSSANMFHYNTIANVFNRSIAFPREIREKRINVEKILGLNFSQSFSQFYEQQYQILKKNLCKTAVSQRQMNTLINCSQIGVGILSNGYIQSSEYNSYMTQKLKENNISLTEISPNEKYLNLFIHIYVREKILLQLKQFRLNLDSNHRRLQQKYVKNLTWFGITFCVFICSFIAYLLLNFIPNLMKIRKIGIGYFKILPKVTINKIQISVYIKQKKLLDRVSLL